MKNSGCSVFVNTIVEKQLTNGPKVSAEFQTIVCLDENNKWVVDCSEPMDIIEIEMLGVKITERANKEKAVDHFESMGINLWKIMQEEMNEVLAFSGDAVTFVKEQTGIILPTKLG